MQGLRIPLIKGDARVVGVTKHLVMAAVADKEILMKLTDAVKSLTLNNVSLITQWSSTMMTPH